MSAGTALDIKALRKRLEKSRTIVGNCTLYNEDNRFILPTLRNVDSIVTDPPYHLTSIVKRFGKPNSAPTKSNGEIGVYGRAARGFMGKAWDGGDIAFDPEFWRLCFDALKPGGHLLAFGGTRTYHRMACAIEDAGFEIRDCIMWVYGSGFPKSHNVSKAIDKLMGADGEAVATGNPVKRIIPGADQHKHGWEKNNGREYQPHDYHAATEEANQWDGWGTALKPAVEPIIVARKALSEKSIAANVLAHGTGALNIDACRVEFASSQDQAAAEQRSRQVAGRSYDGWGMVQQHLTAQDYASGSGGKGRWPANFIHDGSEEVVRLFPETASGSIALHHQRTSTKTKHSFGERAAPPEETFGDAGSAARFFYCAKADKDDRLKSKHPTVKPIDLMAYLVRLVTQPGGTVLDPFAGSGSTGMACMREGMNCILIEREQEYFADILHRVSHVRGEDTPLFAHAEAAGDDQLALEESPSEAAEVTP